METPEHQEWRSRQEVDYRAAIKTALGVGIFLFILPGGSPWSGAGVATTVMGRPMPWGWPLTLVVHLAVCIMYMWVIANAVYRFRLLPAILMGVVTGAGLYALNYVFFAGLGHDFALSHAQAIPSHLALGLFGASMYKALSVPPPMADDSGDTLHPERLDEPVMNSRSPFIQRPSR